MSELGYVFQSFIFNGNFLQGKNKKNVCVCVGGMAISYVHGKYIFLNSLFLCSVFFCFIFFFIVPVILETVLRSVQYLMKGKQFPSWKRLGDISDIPSNYLKPLGSWCFLGGISNISPSYSCLNIQSYISSFTWATISVSLDKVPFATLFVQNVWCLHWINSARYQEKYYWYWD